MVGVALASKGCPNGQIGVGIQQICQIVKFVFRSDISIRRLTSPRLTFDHSFNAGDECSEYAGALIDGNCNVPDTTTVTSSNDNSEQYCQPAAYNHGAKVFCASDGYSVTSVAYDLALWGNCYAADIDCDPGPNVFIHIQYCCEQI